MKVRTAIPGTALGARLAALCWGALTLLAPVAVSACSGPSSSSSTPIFTPSVSTSSATSGPATSAASSGSTASPGGTASPVTPTATQTPRPTVTATVTRTATASPSSSRIPGAAPVTGGGGTAGLQDGLLAGLGAAAILVGAGSIAYRRRLTRNR